MYAASIAEPPRKQAEGEPGGRGRKRPAARDRWRV